MTEEYIPISFLLFLAIIPVVIILMIVYLKDKNKEPMTLLIKLFFFGFISCILVLLISNFMELFLPFMDTEKSYRSVVDILLYAFFGVALVEEFCKWLMVYMGAYHHRAFDELYDGIIYSVFVSLGFAFVENILYVISTYSIETAILRGISAVPGHACDAIFMGYYLSVAKQFGLRKKRKEEKKYLTMSIIVPMILHGIYDFCLMSGYDILVTAFIIFVIILYILSFRKLSIMSKHNRKIKFRNKFCPGCGKIVTGEFCAHCGRKQI